MHLINRLSGGCINLVGGAVRGHRLRERAQLPVAARLDLAAAECRTGWRALAEMYAFGNLSLEVGFDDLVSYMWWQGQEVYLGKNRIGDDGARELAKYIC